MLIEISLQFIKVDYILCSFRLFSVCLEKTNLLISTKHLVCSQCHHAKQNNSNVAYVW